MLAEPLDDPDARTLVVVLLPFFEFGEVVVDELEKVFPRLFRLDDVEQLFFGVDIVNFFVDEPFHELFRLIKSHLRDEAIPLCVLGDLFFKIVELFLIFVEVGIEDKPLHLIEIKIPFVIGFGEGVHHAVVA